jgi:hypothetical protein
VGRPGLVHAETRGTQVEIHVGLEEAGRAAVGSRPATGVGEIVGLALHDGGGELRWGVDGGVGREEPDVT